MTHISNYNLILILVNSLYFNSFFSRLQHNIQYVKEMSKLINYQNKLINITI